MSMKKKAEWMVYGEGMLLSLGSYLIGLALLSFLIIREIYPAGKIFVLTAVICFLASMLGGQHAAHRSSLGGLAGGSLMGLAFALVLVCVGLLCWDSAHWTGNKIILLLCALGGGAVSGILYGRKRKRGNRRKKRS